MATTGTTTPHTATQPGSSLPALYDRLDSLWISYLGHLDAYNNAQKVLQQHLRSGFFSLSRANFSARPGMRYGQDYYHDRAIATRRVDVEQREDGRGDGRHSLSIELKQPTLIDSENDTPTKRKVTEAEVLQQPSPPATPGPEDEDITDDSDTESESQAGANEDEGAAARKVAVKPPLEADPIRWFGILVPQELRSAQRSFTTAVDETLSGAINAGRAMREVEVEIRRLRKEIRKAEKVAKG